MLRFELLGQLRDEFGPECVGALDNQAVGADFVRPSARTMRMREASFNFMIGWNRIGLKFHVQVGLKDLVMVQRIDSDIAHAAGA